MANVLDIQNKTTIELGGEKLTMRARFDAMIAIEEALGRPWADLGDMVWEGRHGFKEVATIIYHGLRGADDTRYSYDKIGEMLVAQGLKSVESPILEFVLKGFKGQKPLGKPDAPEATPK